MIKGFVDKLSELKNRRKAEWKPVRNLQNEANQLKKKEKELDTFLGEVGIDTNKRRNAYSKQIDKKQQKAKSYPIQGSEIIDNAISVYNGNQVCKQRLLDDLSAFLDAEKRKAMHQDAALIMAALAVRELEKSESYEDGLSYKEYMQKAFSVLVTGKDADLYYAQWGKSIYDNYLLKLVKQTNQKSESSKNIEETCIQLCRNAYEKFMKITLHTSETALYAEYVSGDEVQEVELLFLRNQQTCLEPKEVIQRLLDGWSGANRGIIRKYRYDILVNAVTRLGKTATPLNELEDEMKLRSNTFEGDVDALIQNYHKTYCSVIKEENKKRVASYIAQKSYKNLIPQKYQWIKTSRYEGVLKEALLQSMETLQVDELLENEWFYEKTREYIEIHQTKFDNWLTTEIKETKENCKRDYQEQITQRVNQIIALPPSAQVLCANVTAYRQKLKDYALRKVTLDEIEEKAWENHWDNKVPKSVVDKYYSGAKELLNVEINLASQKAKKEAEKKPPTASVPQATFSTSTSPQSKPQPPKPQPSKSPNGLLLWMKRNIPIVIGGVLFVLVVAGVALTSGKSNTAGGNDVAKENTASNVGGLLGELFSKEPELEEYTDDDLGMYLAAEIIKTPTELSETATPISEFSYEQVGYFSEPCIYITRYNGVAEVVEVPGVIDGMNVLGIARDAFRDNIYLKKVILPDTIVSLDGGAFANCTLLEEVVCSANLTQLYNNVFEGCVSLTSFVCKSDDSSISSMKAIGENVFSGCTSLKNVEIQTNTFKGFVFGKNCFSGCENLETVTLNGKRLEAVIVKEGSFSGCTGLTEIPFADKITEMDRWAFANCTGISNIELPKATYIPRAAFENCTALTSFHVSGTVKGIDFDAFKNCTSLATVTFDQVKVGPEEQGYGIGDNAFYNTAITEVEIPGAYETIGDRSFASCPQLTKVVWHNTGKNVLTQFLNDHAFIESYALKELYLPRTLDRMDPQDVSKMAGCTIYAVSGSLGHTFATENNFTWSEWTE